MHYINSFIHSRIYKAPLQEIYSEALLSQMSQSLSMGTCILACGCESAGVCACVTCMCVCVLYLLPSEALVTAL